MTLRQDSTFYFLNQVTSQANSDTIESITLFTGWKDMIWYVVIFKMIFQEWVAPLPQEWEDLPQVFPLRAWVGPLQVNFTLYHCSVENLSFYFQQQCMGYYCLFTIQSWEAYFVVIWS